MVKYVSYNIKYKIWMIRLRLVISVLIKYLFKVSYHKIRIVIISII